MNIVFCKNTLKNMILLARSDVFMKVEKQFKYYDCTKAAFMIGLEIDSGLVLLCNLL